MCAEPDQQQCPPRPSPLLARDRRRTTGRLAPRCPATATPTWRSWVPASPACGPRSTSPVPTRPCGSRCRGRDGRLRRERPQRRLVLGAVPVLPRVRREAVEPGRAPWPCTRRCATASTRCSGLPTRRASTRTPRRAGPSGWPGRRPQWARAQAEVDDTRAWGLGEDDVRLLDAAEATDVLAATRVRGATYTPDCAAIHPARLVRGLADAVVRRGVSLYEQTPATAIAPGRGDHPTRDRAGRARDPGDRGLHPLVGRRASTADPGLLPDHRHRAAVRRRVGADRAAPA